MTDRYEPTPIPAAMERDALVAAVIDSAPLGGILTDGGFQILHASSEACRLLGLDVREGELVAALRSSRIVHPNELAAFVRGVDHGGALRSCHIVEAENGETHCLSIEATQSRQPETRWIWWISDITDSSRARQARLLAEIGLGSQEGVSTQVLAQRLVDACLEILGVDIAVLMLGDWDALRPVATRGMLLEDDFTLIPGDRLYVAKALSSGHAVVSDGSEWDASEQEMTGSHFIIPLGRPNAPMGTLHLGLLDDRLAAVQDIGCQVLDLEFLDALSTCASEVIANTQLFEELREERLKLQTVVDFIPDGVVLFTDRGDVLATNAAARDIVGREWSNLNTDSRTYRLRSPDGELMRRVDWPFFRMRHSRTPILGELVMLDWGNRQKLLSVNVVPVPSEHDDSPRIYVGTLRDVTAERDHQKEREGFLQIVSHELRSPLTPLTGFLQMVRKQALTGETIDADLLERAEHQVGRLARLIDSVLDMTRLERKVELDLETIDLRDVVARSTDLWQSDPRGVNISVSVPDHAVMVRGDVDRLEQVITNLVDNAVKHSDAAGRIDVSLTSSENGPSIVVRDDGRGIASDDLPHVFERFYSAGKTRGGLGIGLYITRQLVEAHGGTISVSSSFGDGATFEVSLPSMSH